jgi:protein-S-isoprenylcysteine O-methyltransferase Ste14
MADRIITFLLILIVLAWFAFIPVNVFRLRIFPPPGLAVSILGAFMGFTGYGIMLLALFQNAFAAPIVKDQSERGQVLINTGLYGLVRHPFYLGFLLFLIGVALWLESYASVLSVSVIFVVLSARMYIEEKILRKELSGYIEYISQVRYRLVPFVW